MTRSNELHTITKGEAKRQAREAHNEGASTASSGVIFWANYFGKQCNNYKSIVQYRSDYLPRLAELMEQEYEKLIFEHDKYVLLAFDKGIDIKNFNIDFMEATLSRPIKYLEIDSNWSFDSVLKGIDDALKGMSKPGGIIAGIIGSIMGGPIMGLVGGLFGSFASSSFNNTEDNMEAVEDDNELIEEDFDIHTCCQLAKLQGFIKWLKTGESLIEDDKRKLLETKVCCSNLSPDEEQMIRKADEDIKRYLLAITNVKPKIELLKFIIKENISIKFY